MAGAEKIKKVTDAIENILKIHERLISKSDSIIVIGGIEDKKIDYVLGEEQNLAQYLIY
jgi:hypothetical protein